MCFNFEASVIAFMIGEISGYLLFKNKDPVYSAFGLFVMWYSFVQLAEAFIYKNYKTKLASQLLLFNLFTQGAVFAFLLHRYNVIDNKLIMLVMALIVCYGMYKITSSDFEPALLTSNCLSCENIKWPFLSRNTINVLSVMYFLIFYVGFTHNSKKVNDITKYFMATLILSFVIPIKNGPSIWCYSSALVAPYLVYLSKIHRK